MTVPNICVTVPKLRPEIFVCFVHIDDIVDYNFLHFLFIMIIIIFVIKHNTQNLCQSLAAGQWFFSGYSGFLYH